MKDIIFTKEELQEIINTTIEMYENPEDTKKNFNLDDSMFYVFMATWMYHDLKRVQRGVL